MRCGIRLVIITLTFFLIMAASANAESQAQSQPQIQQPQQQPPVQPQHTQDIQAKPQAQIKSAENIQPAAPAEHKEDKPKAEKAKDELQTPEKTTVIRSAPEQPSGQLVIKQGEPSQQQMPLSMTYPSNEKGVKAIERSFVLFKETIRSRFAMWLERSGKYIEIMKDVLKERKMPDELVFLPLIESGFNTNAYSSARAVGPWQFISGTAKRYGLVMDWWRDERKDPVKSTRAAADYLTDLYKMFGSWKLALAAYNAGEGRIARAMKKSNANDFWDLLNTKQLPAETKEYVPRYIAATLIANTPEDHGFTDLVFQQPLDFDEVALTRPVDLVVIAACADTTVDVIRELNPELRRWSTPPNTAEYKVRIPAGTRDFFMDNFREVPEEELFSVEKYVVKKGDTVKKISKKTSTPIQAVLSMNSLSGIESLKAGEVVLLPPDGKFSPDRDDKLSDKKKTVKTARKGSKKSGVRKELVSEKKSKHKPSKNKSKTKKT
ncbi:MAG: transglycosylase SLT domain-containing protein [Nitrospiraceae bacterium]|nr:transglycosylase SLT domain-containing protein [Nitrospiraceae bacterium]